jgi:hypothetical protein
MTLEISMKGDPMQAYSKSQKRDSFSVKIQLEKLRSPWQITGAYELLFKTDPNNLNKSKRPDRAGRIGLSTKFK